MGRYLKLVKDNFASMKGNDGVMWQQVQAVDELLEELREPHSSIYWDFQRKAHEAMFGKHFDKDYAEWEVANMHHVGDDGREYKGERWSMKEASQVAQKYRGRYPHEYNDYDIYVALNAQWHDTICTAKRHFASVEEAENYIVDEAIAVWLNDSDWGSTDKVWCYFACKK